MPDSAGTEAAGDAAMLTVGVAGEVLALPAAAVREVLRPTPLTRVPQAPPSLLGLSNLRGAVLPVLSLARITGRAETPSSPASRVVVMEGAAPFGLLVELVRGLGRGETAQAIDLPALLAHDFGAPAKTAPQPPPEPDVASTDPTARTVALLAFTLAGQDYALPLDRVAAVARLPEGLANLPGTDDAMLGVLPFRGEVLPLVSPHALLGLPAMAATSHTRLLVTRLGSLRVGLVVDALRAILRLPDTALDPVPPVLTRGRGEARVEAIARLDGGRRLISVLSPTHLFDEATTARLLAGVSDKPMEETAPAASADAEERFVILRLGDAQFGLPVPAVDEVVRRPATLARIPRAPDFVLGTMNLRGAALPVIDQRRRFGGEASGKGGRVVVVRMDGLRAGFVVDAVPEVLAVAAADLIPAPAHATGGTVFDRVARVERDGRMILLINPHALLEGAERDLLAALAKPRPERAGKAAAP
ncbi:chemotaxis protein CheW [Roseomonas sp. WA12]